MRMNNKTMQIVVDEIYNQVSKPIIEANNKLVESADIDDLYTRDYKKCQKLYKKIYEINKEIEELKENYRYKVFKGFKFDYDAFCTSNYNRYIESQLDLQNFPSKSDIEKEIILAGNKDIPALIELIVNKLK